MAIYNKIQYNTHEEWLEIKKDKLGGSEAAAALGFSPYKSPYTLWCEKTERIPNNAQDNEAMRVGRDLEEYVAQRFTEATGKKVRKCNYTFQSKKYPYAIANVDRLIVGEDAGLECKTASALTRTKYDKDDIPVQYYLQCMHYMAITGKKKWYIAVLVMGKGFYWREVERDENEISLLLEREEEFWNYVVNDQEPPIDDSNSTLETIKNLYPNSNQSTIELIDCESKIERLQTIKELMKSLKRESTQIESELRNEMQEATYGRYRTGEVSLKKQTRQSIDSKLLQELHPDIYLEVLKETTFKKLNIKENE